MNGNHVQGLNASLKRHAVLLVGDATAAHQTLSDALPNARVDTCEDWFDAVAQLTHKSYDAVFAPTGPIVRRMKSAVETVRGISGDARFVLLARPAEEQVARKALAAGCDDYVIWPASGEELRDLVQTVRRHVIPGTPDAGAPVHAERFPPPASGASAPARSTTSTPGAASGSVAPFSQSSSSSAPFGADKRADRADRAERMAPSLAQTVLPLASVGEGLAAGASVAHSFAHIGPVIGATLLDAMVREPADACRSALRELNARLPAGARFGLARASDPDPVPPPGMTVLSHVLRTTGEAPPRVLHLFLSRSFDEAPAAALLDELAPQLSRVLELQARHTKLQRLAITDDLTGLYNARYFKHFLERVLERARQQKSPVTLLLFDIDHFKKYNDQFGHAAGDEILRQTGKMMRRCVRDHDLVARLGGDEFAVVFWEKEGPRQALPPADGSIAPSVKRSLDGPAKVFERFKTLIAGHDFQALGLTGKGQLTISGGLSVYPWDAATPDALIEAADHALMFGAKRSGKNTVHLVGGVDRGEEQAAGALPS